MARGQITLREGLDPQETRITFDGKVVREDANILETMVTLAGIASMRQGVKLAIQDMFGNFPSRGLGDEVIIVAREMEQGGTTIFHDNYARTGLSLFKAYDELRHIVTRRGPVKLKMVMTYVSPALVDHIGIGQEAVRYASSPKKNSRRRTRKSAKK